MRRKPLDMLVDKEELYSLYHVDKLTLEEIGDLYGGYRYSSVAKLMNKHGIPRRTNEEAQKKPLQSLLNKDLLYDLYVKQLKSTERIGKIYNVSHVSILRLLHKYEIETRAPKKIVGVNVDFFKTISNDLAYILGLLATDGCIVGNSVKLGLNDEEVIRWMANKINYRNTIRHITTSAGNKNYRIAFEDDDIIAQLHKYGITERKSFTLQFPEIPDEYVRHFIRGVFDGDGSISIIQTTDKRTDKKVTRRNFSICGASLDFINGIKNAVEKVVGGNRKVIIDKSTKGTLYKYSVGGLNELIQLYDWLYKEDDFGLERKKRKFLMIKASA